MEPGPPTRQPAAPAVPSARATRADPTGMRIILGAGGLVALSALVTAIVVPPAPASAPAPIPAASPATVARQRPVQYIQLAPGQSPPPGATVIDAKAPKPVTIVTRVPAPTPKTVVIRTTQSGKVIP